jgi:hypothetical protein
MIFLSNLSNGKIADYQIITNTFLAFVRVQNAAKGTIDSLLFYGQSVVCMLVAV